MKKIINWLEKGFNFVTTEVWKQPSDNRPRLHLFLIRQVKIIAISVKGFTEEKVQMRASALTFYSLLSVVPVVAMIFGISKGFGFQGRLEAELVKSLQGHEEVVTWIIDFAERMLENARGGLVAGIGLVILFWSVMSVLGNIEGAMNSIWQIRKSRPFVRKFTDYFAVMLIAPVFILLSSSVTVFISSEFEKYAAIYPVIRNFKFLLNLSPYILIWILFIVIIIAMPNTKVKFKHALVGGIIAGSLFQLSQWGYIHFQIGISRYNAIYGSFAALPLFMIWLQISWLIVLLGAQIAFANQNVNKYELDFKLQNLSQHRKRILSLMIARLIVKNFEEGKPPCTATEMSGQLALPVRLVREVIYEMVETKILSELYSDNPKERRYQPAIDIHQVSVSLVLQRLDDHGEFKIGTASDDSYDKINGIIESFRKLIHNSSQNLLLKDI